ncbi:MAG: hypothetical protein RLZZ127_2372 [Planctomycetota bacterium]|jgi:chromosome segregation ATPase
MIRPLLLAAVAVLASAAEDDRRLQDRIAALEQRIQAMESARGGAAAGTGAYARGSSLRIDGAGESVLERLRRMEQELAEARAVIGGRERELAAAREQARSLASEGSEAAERAAGLEHVRTSLVTAQQVLAERQTAIEALQAQLAASELARLKAERSHLTLAAAVLRLQPQPAAVNDLQEQVRAETRSVGVESK